MRDLGLMWAVGLLLKGTALLVLVLLVVAALRRASAGLRHLVWSGGIVALLALPLVSLALPWRLPVVAPQLAGVTAAATSQATGSEARPAPQVTAAPRVSAGPAAPGETASRPATPPSAAASSWRLPAGTLAGVFLALWIGGAVLLLARLGLGVALLKRIVRRARPLDTPDWSRPLLEGADRLGLERVPRLVMSERLPMPFACGVVAPTIVLPATAAGWSDRRRRAVLCHELAHIRRRDLPVNALAQLACALYWFHPLVWLAARKLRMESERACDDLVLGVGTRPSEYADHLLQIVCGAARARTPAVALPMAERREFEGRMLAILERDARREAPARRHALALAGFAVALVVPLAALGPAARQAAKQPVAPPPSVTRDDAAAARVATPPGNVAAATQRVTQHTQTLELQRQATSTQTSQSAEPQGKGDKAKARELEKEQNKERDNDQGSQQSDPKVVAALIAALDDSVASVREDAAYALGQLEAKDAATPLGARLGHEPDAKVRTMIAWALGQIESRDGTTPLSRIVQSDPSPKARAMAIWALGRLEDPAGIPALASALRDTSEEVRGRAAWAIGTIEPKTAPPELVAALKDSSATVRYRAAWAVGRIADPAAVPALTAAMKDSSPEVRKAAFWALGQMDDPAAQPALIQALKDPDPEVRAAAARALGGGHMDPWPWPWPMPIIK
jgi:HEAT repeat protein/beta-lactamase regulating signal transducer with metallopeptidase domain